MITFENWEIRAYGGLAHQYDNLSRRLEVLGDLPEGWDWTMLVQVDDHMDLIPLTPMEGGIGADLSREQLALAGIYELQLRGSQGDRVRHSNTEYVQVFHSLSGDVQWPEIPTQFTQLEQRIQEVNSHPPIPGENRFWLVWDVEKDEYIESEYPLPSGNGNSSSGTDGGYYIPGVDETTGLLTFTPSKEDMPTVAAANVRGPQGEAGPKGDKGDTGPQGPAGVDGKDGAGLEVTGASVGQIVRIAAVDADGIPTAWEAVDLPVGGGTEVWCDDLLASGTLVAGNAVLYDTGITLAKLREYKTFSYRLKGASNTNLSNLYLRMYAEDTTKKSVALDRDSNSGRIVEYEWANAEKTVLRPFNAYSGNCSMVSLGSVAVAHPMTQVLYGTGQYNTMNYVDLSASAETDKLFFYCENTPSVDYAFELRGLTK